jgi:flagella basal body P-ring formation protein FlgA
MKIWTALRALAAVLALWPIAASPQTASPPTPKAVIYTGDVIRDDMLIDSDQNAPRDRVGAIVEDRAAIIGKVARLTLLPGRLIPYDGVSSASWWRTAPK